ncbi:hypothetical protein V8C37DRAFT_314766 [Trichoderma ceciliae]
MLSVKPLPGCNKRRVTSWEAAPRLDERRVLLRRAGLLFDFHSIVSFISFWFAFPFHHLPSWRVCGSVCRISYAVEMPSCCRCAVPLASRLSRLCLLILIAYLLPSMESCLPTQYLHVRNRTLHPVIIRSLYHSQPLSLPQAVQCFRALQSASPLADCCRRLLAPHWAGSLGLAQAGSLASTAQVGRKSLLPLSAARRRHQWRAQPMKPGSLELMWLSLDVRVRVCVCACVRSASLTLSLPRHAIRSHSQFFPRHDTAFTRITLTCLPVLCCLGKQGK